ncbi:MAG: ABC transporter substrate-binding protein, partial [Mycobacterium sp.]|nr:ABC transporter substrate-binding protein [Mycobacterium sp.]
VAGSSTSAAAAGTAGAEQPRSGGTLRFGTPADLLTLDGQDFTSGGEGLVGVWDRLLEQDENLVPQPRLAESFDWSSNGQQLTLNLRKGVQFHTGRELTAEDVVWNLKRATGDSKLNGGVWVATFRPMTSVEATDKYSLVLKSEQPWPGVFDALELLNIVDPVTMQGPDGPGKPVGTGPFTFVEWAQGDHVRVVKNKNYWQSGRPYVDEIVTTVFRDPQAMVVSLESGALDLALNLPLNDFVRLQNGGKYQMLPNPLSGSYYALVPNLTVPPLENKQVRQALNFAIDRQRVLDQVLQGIGRTEDLPWAPSSPAYEPEKNMHYAFDLDKAKSLLASAGVSGVKLDLMYSTAISALGTIAQIIQSDLAKIGITINLAPTDPAAASAAQREHRFQLILGGGQKAQLHPSKIVAGPFWDPAINIMGVHDDNYTQLVAGMSSEVDPAKRKQVYSSFNDYVLEQSYNMPIASLVQLAAMTPTVHGPRYNMNEWLLFNDTWLSA